MSREKKILVQRRVNYLADIANLSEEEKAIVLARRAYKKAWRENNKEKIKAANDRFYKKQAEKLASQAQKETV